jgi:hypothetical protein
LVAAQMRNVRRRSACQHGLGSVRQMPQQQGKRCFGLLVRRGLGSHARTPRSYEVRRERAHYHVGLEQTVLAGHP